MISITKLAGLAAVAVSFVSSLTGCVTRSADDQKKHVHIDCHIISAEEVVKKLGLPLPERPGEPKIVKEFREAQGQLDPNEVVIIGVIDYQGPYVVSLDVELSVPDSSVVMKPVTLHVICVRKECPSVFAASMYWPPGVPRSEDKLNVAVVDMWTKNVGP